MNLSSFNFLRGLREENQQFAVVGLGRFGCAVCSTLNSLRYEVLAVDRDEKRVNQALNDEIAAHAIRLDSTDPIALRKSGLFEFDTAIVSIGNYLAESIITTLNLKEGGVKTIIAKASSDIHMKLLQKVGADRVIFPEREMGCELARRLTRPSIIDQFELDPDHSIVEVAIPEQFHGKTLAELELRSRYGVNAIAVSHDRQFEINPNPNTPLHPGSAMVVVGSNKDIDRLPIQ